MAFRITLLGRSTASGGSAVRDRVGTLLTFSAAVPMLSSKLTAAAPPKSAVMVLEPMTKPLPQVSPLTASVIVSPLLFWNVTVTSDGLLFAPLPVTATLIPPLWSLTVPLFVIEPFPSIVP